MVGKICLVTGANSGIGRSTAHALAGMGAAVVMLCRDRQRAEPVWEQIKTATGNGSVELMICDLSSQKDIRRFAAEFIDTHRRLDVLINNAGLVARQRSLTEDGIETTFAVNHLGYFLLTNLLLDLLKRSAPARIVSVSSAGHALGKIDFDNLQGEKKYGGFSAYANSKLANVLFTHELARRLEGTAVTANCLHPGGVGTGLFRSLPKPLEALIKLLTISPDTGAETSVYLASSAEVEGITGKYFVKKREKRTSDQSYDEGAAQRLWEVSSELVGLV
ncbi:MAG TPA: SDR family oxidoreductase [Blastocatellia bacterium]|nr:SDR family oxidoreductase [Blastocatellia bacterium]